MGRGDLKRLDIARTLLKFENSSGVTEFVCSTLAQALNKFDSQNCILTTEDIENVYIDTFSEGKHWRADPLFALMISLGWTMEKQRVGACCVRGFESKKGVVFNSTGVDIQLLHPDFIGKRIAIHNDSVIAYRGNLAGAQHVSEDNEYCTVHDKDDVFESLFFKQFQQNAN